MVDLFRKVIGNRDVYAHVIKVSEESPGGKDTYSLRRFELGPAHVKQLRRRDLRITAEALTSSFSPDADDRQ
jgi:hypothetical protein